MNLSDLTTLLTFTKGHMEHGVLHGCIPFICLLGNFLFLGYNFALKSISFKLFGLLNEIRGGSGNTSLSYKDI